MRVGIITYHCAHNYGAMLQAYALQHAIESLGHEACFINFYPRRVKRKNRKLKRTLKLRTQLRNLKVLRNFSEWKRRFDRYESFMTHRLNLTECYETPDQLQQSPPEFDAYICGSDQIWNPRRNINSVFFLNWVKNKNARRIAYAPSFGVEKIPDEYKAELTRLIEPIDCLSVRESSGIKIIEDLIGRIAEHVLDPTLLLSESDWENVSSAPDINEPYMLVYGMEESDAFVRFVSIATKKIGLPVIVIGINPVNRYKSATKYILDAGPSEFVGLFRKAAFVCTNSFHGTAFSIICRKPFFSVPHSCYNSRISSLLKLTGLKDRQLGAPEELGAFSKSDLEIDYEAVEIFLANEKENSLEYLRKALSLSAY